MPLKYAIQEIVPIGDLRPDETLEYWNSETIYHPASQDVAETDENGSFCLVNNKGEEVSPWMPLDTQKEAEEVRTAKSKGRPHKDIMGEELAIGDFVAVANNENAELDVGKVLAFTGKKVRVLIYRGPYEALKNPSGLVKIQPTILSD